MMPVWMAAGLVFLGLALLAIALCHMAAAGDRQLAEARDELARRREERGAGL